MLRWPKIEAGAHVRTCQECGHAQKAKDPATMKGEGWRDLKCKRCKSESMDFGCANLEIVEEED
jgi:hypothetical protein